MLGEGSCGRLIHDLKLSGGSLRNVCLFLEASRRRVESTMARLRQVQVPLASSQMELHPRRRSIQEDFRRCHGPPGLSSFGFEGDVCALPIGTHRTLFPWTISVSPQLLLPSNQAGFSHFHTEGSSVPPRAAPSAIASCQWKK